MSRERESLVMKSVLLSRAESRNKRLHEKMRAIQHTPVFLILICSFLCRAISKAEETSSTVRTSTYVDDYDSELYRKEKDERHTYNGDMIF